tara:strand:- start:365 stop:787 length:423 start_codon:yes stop_codon:yes gene_type:complete
MAPRKKKRVVRRKSFSLLNALESYTYASILSQGIAGTTPFGMLTGEGNIGTQSLYDSGLGVYSAATVTGADQISLADIAKNPGLAISEMGKNLQANIVPMAVASLTTGVAFRFGRRLLRRPISNINRNLVKPMLGAGIRI